VIISALVKPELMHETVLHCKVLPTLFLEFKKRISFILIIFFYSPIKVWINKKLTKVSCKRYLS